MGYINLDKKDVPNLKDYLKAYSETKVSNDIVCESLDDLIYNLRDMGLYTGQFKLEGQLEEYGYTLLHYKGKDYIQYDKNVNIEEIKTYILKQRTRSRIIKLAVVVTLVLVFILARWYF